MQFPTFIHPGGALSSLLAIQASFFIYLDFPMNCVHFLYKKIVTGSQTVAQLSPSIPTNVAHNSTGNKQSINNTPNTTTTQNENGAFIKTLLNFHLFQFVCFLRFVSVVFLLVHMQCCFINIFVFCLFGVGG